MTYGESALAACKGKTVKLVSGLTVGSEDVQLQFTDGTTLRMYHEPDCCETVDVQQIDGEGSDLLGSPLEMAPASPEVLADQERTRRYRRRIVELRPEVLS